MDRNEVPVAIGIDLGTTYSCVGVWKNDRIEIIPNNQGNRTTPSCVAFVDHEAPLIGDGAKNQAVNNPTNTIFDAKRLIGRRFSDSKVQDDMKLWPFKVIEGPSDTPKIVVSYKGQEKEYLAEEISSMILGRMKEIAESYLGKPVKNAVITVPTYFNDSQRQATKNAGAIAGLNVISMINEPTAAAIAIAYGGSSAIINKKKNVLVFDLGGGTFDISILTINKEGNTFEVKAVSGDTHLGGNDFDNRMVDHCVEEFKRKWNKDLTMNKKALGRLRCACEKTKRVLSCYTGTSIELDCLHEGIDFSMKFSRSKFEELNMDLFDRCMKSMEACLKDARMEISWVSEVILVGGSTRIPKIQSMLKKLFYSKELYKSLNPDEAVAYGAAVLAAKLSGGNMIDKSYRGRGLVLREVTPLSIGVETSGGVFSVVVPRNTPIPTRILKTYYTRDTCISIKVYQGERAKCIDNHFSGMLELSGIPLDKEIFDAYINVCFEIDASGILTVTAGIESTGRMETLTFTKENGRLLCKEDIEYMVKDAEKYKREDHEYKMREDALKDLNDYVHMMKAMIGHIPRAYSKNLKEVKHMIADTTKWIEQNQTAPVDKVLAKAK